MNCQKPKFHAGYFARISYGLTTNICNTRWVEPPKRLDNSKHIFMEPEENVRGILMYLINIGIKRNSRNKIDRGVLKKLNLNSPC